MKLRFEKREKQNALRTLAIMLACVLLALVFCGIIIAASGFSPFEVYGEMFRKSFFSLNGIQKMLMASLPLLFCGLAVALTFKMNLNNIGAEGQYALGVIAGGAFVLYGPEIEGFPGLLILAVCCFTGGAFWALLCALPKAYWDVNESITTLMMNYIALTVLTFLCQGPWKMSGQNVSQTERIPEGLELTGIQIGKLNISYGILLGILAAAVIFAVYRCTAAGYRISVIGNSPAAAKYAGINIRRSIIAVMLVSGGLAGLAGFTQYTGVTHRIMEGMPNGAGYTGIVIAFLSRLNPLAVVVVSVLFAGLQNSTAYVQAMGVSSRLSYMMQGAIMLFVIAGEFFRRYRLLIVKEAKS